MFKREITFTDFNDNQVTEEHYFHLSMAELTEMELSHKGGLSDSLQKIIDAEDGKGIVEIFKDIILTSYGKKSADGRKFIKSKEQCDEFMQTGAYSELFMELVTDATAAAEFINGLVPKGMTEKVSQIIAEKQSAEKAKTDESTDPPKLAAVPEDEVRTITAEELEALRDQDKAQAYMDLAAGKLKLITHNKDPQAS